LRNLFKESERITPTPKKSKKEGFFVELEVRLKVLWG
jgi:hypothetical protein